MPQIDNTLALSAGRDLPKFGPDWGVIQNALKTQIAMQQARDVQASENALRQAFSAQQPGETQFSPQTINNLGARSPDAAYQAQRMNALAAPLAANMALQSAYGNRDNRKPGSPMLSDDAIADLLRTNPQAAAKAIELNSQIQTTQTQKSARDSEQFKRLNELYDEGEGRILAEYQANAKSWGSPGQALDKANADLKELKDRLKQGGATDEFLRGLPPTFSEQSVTAKLTAKNAADIAKQKDLEGVKGEIYTGKDKASGDTVRFRYTPDGPVSADPLPGGQREKVDVNSLTNIEKFGTREPKELYRVTLPDNTKTLGHQSGTGFVDIEGKAIQSPKDAVKVGTREEGGGEIQLSGDPSLEGKEYLATLPVGERNAVQLMLEGKIAPPGTRDLNKPDTLRRVAEARQVDPGFDATDWFKRYKVQQSYAAGPDHRDIQSFNMVIRHARSLSEAADDLKNFGGVLTPFNVLKRAYQTGTGDPRYKVFATNAQALSGELTRAFRGAAGSLKELEDWKATLDSAGSPEAINGPKGVINKAMELLGGRVETKREDYERAMGPRARFNQFLTPSSKAAIGSVPGGAKLMKEFGISDEEGRPETAPAPPTAGTREAPAGAPAAGAAPQQGATARGPVPTPADFGGQKYLTNRQTSETWVIGPDGKVVPYVAGQK